MSEHGRLHDPDQIVRPDASSTGSGSEHSRSSSENTDLVSMAAPAPAATAGPASAQGAPPSASPASGRAGGTSQRPGFWLSLTTIERAEFLATAQEVVYPAGTVLWEEDQAADHTIVIKSGSVRVCVERDGRERIIAFRGPGDIIGERAALLLRRRSATIVAMETLHALRLTTQQFVTYLSNHPRVVVVMEREMYHRLTEQSRAMRDETGQYRPAPTPGPVTQYPPQVYATAYIPIPAVWPHPPQGVPATYGPSPGPYVAGDQYTPPGPYTVPAADPHRTNGDRAAGGRRPTGGSSAGRWAPMEEAASAAWQARPAADVQVPFHGQPTQPMAITPSGSAGPSWAGQNCTIVFTDIAGFSSRVRDENDRLEVRRAMYAALRQSFEESRVPWDACYSEDRGDGALIVVPPGIPTAAVIDPMIAALGMRLRRHNHRSSEAVRIQLRVALDVGPVLPDPPGVSGWTIINAARLLDAAPFKERLAATGADLGVIASRFVYDSVIAHSPGYVNAAEYEPIGCRVKETDIEGWIHLRGLPARSAI
ncbi:cyclic nucleotide-binding domain-containing protein [Actinomadura bangladeshensis]|uniref:Cyclic nucleotide-binding domain-containing protein n=1 Tax=Actinomadura bangladeshensis TaxID=453573 RepID=A0A4R4PE45_9ACTN|nr:cyclic nucleotide-binding domain-containing protein [Actinomadura bangladeshensis]TDC19717.1 cyclic nucleotide-binding domain-containing protein [Actinomadura bangladeshensis]